ncbi:response regulator receiver domain [Pseudoalteromonas mariniglutinosa]|uniref:response regulator receiver domain n=1 Tax=Pseudoalteromonas mariniglutinosa TaxID=206042 RepID=UPI00385154A7
MTEGISFLEHSKQITEHFLQSVVAVDDNMEFKSRQPETMEDLVEPDEDDYFGQIESTDNQEEALLEHKLYYQDLSLEFASRGIVCGGFSPTKDTNFSLDAIVNTSKNADITILDWQMQIAGADGKLAIDTIKEIAKLDTEEGGRTRLICIYTAENANDVAQILVNSVRHLSPNQKQLTISFGESGLSHWKIEIVNKEKQEVELCEFLINSFTELTAGLLSNAALSSIAAIRDNTHHLLHKFNKDLDPAYLSHVLGLLSSPDMREQANDVAFDYAVDLISEELKSNLQVSRLVKNSLSKDKLCSWPEFINEKNDRNCFRLKIGSEGVKRFDNNVMKNLISAQTVEELEKVLEHGVGLSEVDNKAPLERFKRSPIQLTSFNDCNSPLLELCAIESVRRDISSIREEHIPVLKQGTIIKEQGQNKYYFCIQPVCDSVRLTGNSTFSLMQISKSSSFTHVIRATDKHLKLKIQPAPKLIRTYTFFACDEHKVVRASKQGELYLFTDISAGEENKVVFEWCGELKQSVSQAVINNLASQLARVGLDSFEWLRQKQS